jgi:enoyl-CoA hydratase/carnithine racemase
MQEFVLRSDSGTCAVLELNQPDRGNALSAAMVRELRANLAEVFSNRAVDTVVLAGGGRNFCTGFDLGGIESSSDGDVLHRFVQIELLLSDLWHAPVRTVALAKGRTWGAGADILAACDHRIAQASATFRFPGAGFGIVLGTRRLCERIGETVARYWIAGNVEVTASNALQAGLVTSLAEWNDAEAWIADALPKLRIERETLDGLHRASRPDLRDTDLANLVRSATKEGLRDRIIAYANSASRASTKGSAR